MNRDEYSKDAALGRMLAQDPNFGPNVQARAGRTIARLVAACRRLRRHLATLDRMLDEQERRHAAAVVSDPRAYAAALRAAHPRPAPVTGRPGEVFPEAPPAERRRWKLYDAAAAAAAALDKLADAEDAP